MATHHFLALAALLLLATALTARHMGTVTVCACLGILSAVASLLTWPLPA